MQGKAGVDQKASDAELIALLCKTQGEIDIHNELNELNLPLHAFAKELLKQRRPTAPGSLELSWRIEEAAAARLPLVQNPPLSIRRRVVPANLCNYGWRIYQAGGISLGNP
jgi:hypothetical protein